MKIGAVNAMAAIGMVEKARAPPASIPAHRQVIASCALEPCAGRDDLDAALRAVVVCPGKKAYRGKP
jgi:hypothetical protein